MSRYDNDAYILPDPRLMLLPEEPCGVTTVMDNPQTAFWTDYYQGVFESSGVWLDYSNERVQAQTFGVAIEAAGPLAGRRCLDVGCGRGQFSLCLAALSAGEVVGIDIVPEAIETCRREHPEVRWETGTPEDELLVDSLGTFDRIFLLEVLQYVRAGATLDLLWRRVRPGGRICVVVPNPDDALVRKTISKFQGYYAPPSAAELSEIAASLPDVECWALRGMAFQEDQRLLPYSVSPWTTEPKYIAVANRIIWAALKRADAP
jgi:SAM-dependent methyltransferase